MRTRTIARFGLLAAVALVLGYIERFIPIAVGIPGIKLGLANTVLLYAIYLLDVKSAWLLMLVKVLLSGLLFAGVSGMIYSLAGGILSLLIMLAVRRIPGVSEVGVSVAGAVGHNAGQLGAACFMVRTSLLIGYLPVLLVAGVATGVMTGLIAKYAIRAIEKAGRGA